MASQGAPAWAAGHAAAKVAELRPGEKVTVKRDGDGVFYVSAPSGLAAFGNPGGWEGDDGND